MTSSIGALAMTQAVFLDRDGTLNIEVGYIRAVEDLNLIPGAAQAIKQLNNLGVLAILTTNQSGPARGFYGEDHVQALHQRLEKLLWDEAQAKLDAIYYCPYHERATVEAYQQDHPDRKPGIGMIQKACERFPNIDLKQSYVFGDKASDVEMAVNAGCKGVLLKTGYGQRVLDGKYQVLQHQPDFVFDTIGDAVQSLFPVAATAP